MNFKALLSGFALELDKLATPIDVLTGRMGSGKSTLAEEARPSYDLVVGTDTGGMKGRKFERPSPEERAKIREAKRAQVLEAHKAGKRVLLEGHPVGVQGVMGEDLKHADRVLYVATPKKVALKRVADRAAERGSDVAEDLAAAAKFDGPAFPKAMRDIAKVKGVKAVRKLGDFVKKATPNFALRVEKHHKAEDKNWGQFEKDLSKRGFRAAVLLHPDSDAKLKRYVKAMGAYKDSKDVAGVVPSRTKPGSLYTIKKLPDGRLACGCKDWQYVHSHRNSDCAHIQELKPVLEKTSGLAQGLGIGSMIGRTSDQWRRGKTMKENVSRLHSGQDLVAVPKRRIV